MKRKHHPGDRLPQNDSLRFGRGWAERREFQTVLNQVAQVVKQLPDGRIRDPMLSQMGQLMLIANATPRQYQHWTAILQTQLHSGIELQTLWKTLLQISNEAA